MDIEGLDIVLYHLYQDFETAQADVTQDIKKARTTSIGLDEAEDRIRVLQQKIPGFSPPPSTEEVTVYRSETTTHTIAHQNWSEIRCDAEKRLIERGVNPATINLDTLLDPKEVERIERRFQGSFSLSTRLDGYDVAAAAVAGLVAGLVDFLIVRIPKDIKYLGKYSQSGSPLTKWIHSLSIPSDNWLAQHFKTSYDAVSPIMSEIPGFLPQTHRLQTFGHDPLVGLVIGTIDIMRGGLTAISKDGTIIILNNTGRAYYNPFTAFVWQVMHLLSDGFTKMGLPPPGWSLLQLLQVGSFGEKERTIADLARFMYLNGYDSRHFLTMSTSATAVEIVLRGYFWLRRKLDTEYDADVTHSGEVIGAKHTGDYPRFQAMALTAHATAAAINAGKVAIYAGNPLAINYVQWLRFFHATFAFMRTKMQSPSDMIIGHGRANWQALVQGWVVVDVNDTAFPTLLI